LSKQALSLFGNSQLIINAIYGIIEK